MRKRLRGSFSNNDIFTLHLGIMKMQKVVILLVLLFMLVGSVLPTKPNKVHALDLPSASETETATEQNQINYPTTTDSDFDYSQVELLGEVNSERTENSKTFQRVDGSFVVAMYNDVIHFEDNGEMKDIDNTMIYDDSSEEYSNKDNKYSIKFPKNLDGNKKIKLTLDKYSIDWTVLSISESAINVVDDTDIKVSNMKELTNITQKATYFDIFSNVDLTYYANGGNVKEDIILNQYIEDFSVTFEYSIKNLTLINDDVNISFVNEDGEEIFSFRNLYAYDASGNITYDISVNVEETKKDEYQITISINDDWMKSASYPVIIDPTINTTNQSVFIQDTYVYQGAPTTNYSTVNYMIVSGVDDVYWYKGLLKFTLPSAVSDKTITYANLTMTKNYGTTDRTIAVYKNTSYFSTLRVNWNTSPSFNSNIIDYHVVGTDSKYIFNITETVKDWQSGSSNYGFTIIDKNIFNAFNSLRTSEYTGSTSDPVVEIGYVDSTGLKDFWTYNSQDAGEAGTGYISDYTGLMTFIRNDINFSTERQTLALSMIYNVSNKNVDLGYGLGWQTNYNMKVEYDDYLDLYFAIDSTGSKVYYHEVGICNSTSINDYPSYLAEILDTSANEYGEIYIAEDGSGQLLMIHHNSQDVELGAYILATNFTL